MNTMEAKIIIIDENRVETAILAESIKCLSLIIEIMFIALITVFLTFISTMIQ